MASVRAQLFDLVEAKLEGVREALDWAALLRNPVEPVGEDQCNALVLLDGGDRAPQGLTGHVERRWLEFSVGMIVREAEGTRAHQLLDAGFVAVVNALCDPADIQLSQLAVAIEMGALSDPVIGRAPQGARVMGGQSIDFSIEYLAREGDAETPGP